VEECALEGRRGIALPDLFDLVAARSDAKFDDKSERILAPPSAQIAAMRMKHRGERSAAVQAEDVCLHCNANGEIMAPDSLSPSLPPSLPPSLALPLFLSLLPTSFSTLSPSPSLTYPTSFPCDGVVTSVKNLLWKRLRCVQDIELRREPAGGGHVDTFPLVPKEELEAMDWDKANSGASIRAVAVEATRRLALGLQNSSSINMMDMSFRILEEVCAEQKEKMLPSSPLPCLAMPFPLIPLSSPPLASPSFPFPSTSSP
jgi:hypothetical protein